MYQAARLLVPSPILTLGEMEALKAAEYRGWKAVTLDASIDAAEARSNPHALREALHTLCAQAEAAVLEQEAPLLVLSDRAAGRDRLPVPSLLACAAVHQHLLGAKARTRTGLLVEAGDEVIVPALTFVATANAVAYLGARPHFADSEESTLGLDAAKLANHLERTTEIQRGSCVNASLCYVHT